LAVAVVVVVVVVVLLVPGSGWAWSLLPMETGRRYEDGDEEEEGSVVGEDVENWGR
jgi:uncharacterized membrane protein